MKARHAKATVTRRFAVTRASSVDSKGTRAPSRRRLLAVALASIAALMAFAAPSALALPHVFSTSFGSKGSGDGQLELATDSGLAVNDTTHDVYVADTGNHRVDQFTATGTFVRAFGADVGGAGVDVCTTGCVAATPGTGPGAFEAPTYVAVDNSGGASQGDVYVADTGDNKITKFDQAGVLIATWGTGGQLTGAAATAGPFARIFGIAVGASGTLFVYDESKEALFKFAPDGTPEPTVTIGRGALPAGIAVDAASNFYKILGSFRETVKFNSEGSEFGEIDPFAGISEDAGLAADLSTGELYVDRGLNRGIGISRYEAGCNSGCTPTESFGAEQVHQGGGAVAVDPSSSAVFLAQIVTDQVSAFVLPVPGAPTIGSESVSGVTATSADLHAEINPEQLATSYRFEYGPTTSYGTAVPVPDGNLGAAYGPRSVEDEIVGLSPSTTYHYRLVVENIDGRVPGPDQTFTTQPIDTALPDGRGYELVSPVEKEGGQVQGIDEISSGGVIQAAADGNAVTYLMYSALGPARGAPFANQYVSRRSATTWSTEDIDGPTNAQSYPLIGRGTPFRQFSTDLSLGIEPNFNNEQDTGSEEDPQLSPEAPVGYQNLFLRNTITGAITPVMTDSNSTRTLPARKFSLELAAASPNLEHVVFYSSDALVPGVLAGSGGALYEWNDGTISPVSVLPGGTVTGAAGIGGGIFGGGPASAVSQDGSRVAFVTTEEGENSALYVRLGIGTPSATTVQIDADHGGGESGDGQFTYASSDMSHILFTDRRKLTANATGPSGLGPENDLGNLYSYDLETGELTDLTVDTSPDPNAANVVGFVGASTDGSYVYFVANGRLAGGSKLGNCREGESTTVATCNLYVEHDGAVSTVSQLSSEDHQRTSGSDWHPFGLVADDWAPNLVERSVRVSPDGRELLFMSHLSLTGYDNKGPDCVPVEHGEPTKDEYTPGRCTELFRYSATEGDVSCISCNMNGATPERPSGIPPGTATSVGEAFYQSRVLTDGGKRIFFESADSLAPGATPGKIGVYEWEADEVGSCHQGGGCVFLVSGRGSGEDAAFVDASENGDDVFFLTSSRLVGADDDQAIDLYDARVGGGSSPTPVTPSCRTIECARTSTDAPSGEAPPTASLQGAGNLRESGLSQALSSCRRKTRAGSQRRRCERKARRRFGPHKNIKGAPKKATGARHHATKGDLR